MKKVCIIGLGWLGKQLGKQLDLKGYKIVGTYRSARKKSELMKLGWELAHFSAENFMLSSDLIKGILSSEVVILTIPPSNLKENYARSMENLLLQIKSNNPTAVIFYTSSSSVYGNYDNAISLNENSPLYPTTLNAKEIVKVEKLLQLNFEKYSILRLGGLVGPNRHPIKYLKGKVELEKPNAPVNLVHSKDIGEFILGATLSNIFPRIVNLVSPNHPNRINYYTRVAKKLKLEIPQFNLLDERGGKKVDSVFLESMNFQFNYSSPFDYPIEIN